MFVSDPTAMSLEKILHSPDFERISDVPVFDEHDEYGPDGKIIRKFDKAELDEIARASNQRAKDSGTLTLIGPGHTIDDQFDKNGRMIYKAKETDQPPVWAYAANYAVKWLKGKYHLVCDWFVDKKYKAELGSYPHRSIELWFRRKIVDWIAAMRRPPARDLGLLIYGRDEGYKQEPLYYDATHQKALAAYMNRLGKLRYSMEESMADPTGTHTEERVPKEDEAPPKKDTEGIHPESKDPAPPEKIGSHHEAPPGVPPEFHEHFQRCMAHSYPHLAKMHEKYSAAHSLSATNGAIPSEAGGGLGEQTQGEEKERMAREESNLRFSRQQAEINELKLNYARARCEQIVTQLQAEGFELDRAKEVETMARLNDKDRAGHVEHIKKYYRQAPVSTGFDPTDIALASSRKRQGAREFGEAELEKALKYQRTKNCSWEEAEEYAMKN